ncbi:MAG: CocE/NonD family hydrolase [Candidatus Hodarchaeota archaeon]
MKKKYVTTLSYLKVGIRPLLPNFIRKIFLIVNPHGVLPIVKLLALLFRTGFPKFGVKRYPEYMLILKDGTKLATDVYVPKIVLKKKRKCPTILIRLPYWKDNFSVLGYAYAAYGFVTILQDIRGTGHSEGFNYYLFTEREDGLETLEWISKQYWYNGKIGMIGASYFGITQLALSWDNKYLTCIAPAITSTLNLWKNNGGLQIHELTNSIYRIMVNIVSHRDAPRVDKLTNLMQERYLNPRYALFSDSTRKRRKITLSQLKGKSINEIQDLLIKYYDVKNFNPSKRNLKTYFTFLNDFLITRGLDKDTEKMTGFLNMDVKKFSQPALMLTGWQDMFFEKQLIDFLEIKANATGLAKEYTKLIIGSWGHAASGHPESRLNNAGILKFFKEFLCLGWNKYWLMDDEKAFPEIDKPSIKYWVMGKNIWKYTERWPPDGVKYQKIYIHSQGHANSVKGNGFLSFDKPNEEPEDQYIFDPLDPVITKGGRNLGIRKGSRNQKDAEKRDDVLIYTSKSLDHGLEITGQVKIILYASTSAKDTDFMVKLVDVYPRGRAINILDAGVRAMYRNGEDNPSLIEPSKIYRYEINLGNISNYFRKRHRIRIEITSSNFPRFDINSNLGGDTHLGEYIVANQKIYHNQTYPSHLIIPTVPEKSEKP